MIDDPCEKPPDRMGFSDGDAPKMKACPQCLLRYQPDAVYCFLDGAELRTVHDTLIGATVAGRYLIEEMIGRGGMATVYRARHKLADSACAIKVVNRTLAADATVRERFRREAKSTQILVHPNIVEIFDHGETSDGIPYLVMELLDGKTLAALIHDGPPPLARAIPIMIQLARGIARAHDLGVVHRDLKPENAFVCRRADGTDLVKILDFGIARSRNDPRMTSAGELFGTPQYIAPERAMTGDAGPSVDLYALGVIFYEIATGKLPFEASSPAAFIVKHINERPPPPRLVDPRVPLQLDALVMQLLEKEPRARPVDAHRVEQDLITLADAWKAPIPPDPQKDPSSSRAPSPPLRSIVAELPAEWAARLEVFEQMVGRGRVPEELERSLADMKNQVSQLADARRSTATDQRELVGIEARGREGRQRFGFAVDALGMDASRARDELRAARIDADRLAHQTKRASFAYAAALREAVTWEGRSGTAEPYPQLAEAYRNCAGTVDAWVAARIVERSAQATLVEKERTASDLDYQIAELRAALSSHEQAIDDKRATAHERVLECSARAERIEARLVAIATRFCEPLREREDLGPLFRRLEAVVNVQT